MADGTDYSTIAQDPDFLKAPVDQQLSYLAHVDPEFAKASPSDKLAYLNHLKGVPSSPAEAVASGASPEQLQSATQAQAQSQATSGVTVRRQALLETPETDKFLGIDPNYDPDKAEKQAVESLQPQNLTPGQKQMQDDYGKVTDAMRAVGGGLVIREGVDAINAMRAARAAKLANNALEWRRINGVLNVPLRGVITSPAAGSAAEATTMPGRTVAELGYSANDLAKMDPMVRMNVLNSHLQNAGQDIAAAAKAATQAGKTLDVGDSAMNVFKSIKDPAMQEKMISQFNATAKELGITNLRQATPEQALALRQALRAGKSFSGFSDIQTVANISKQLGGAVSSDLKTAVPDFVDLDRRYSDLKAATNAAQNQVRGALAKTPPPSLAQRIGRFAVQKVLPRLVEGTAIGAGSYGAYRGIRDVTGQP